MRPFVLLAILTVLLPLAAARLGGLAGGWSPIKDLKDPHVKEIADFAVSEHNKKSHENLVLKSILKGETQVVSGENYRLVLAVKAGSSADKYEAVVYEKSWENYKELLSFNATKN